MNFKQNLINNAKNIGKTLKRHSPEILIGAGIAGFVSTVFMVAKEAPVVKEKLDELHEELAEKDEELSKADIIFEEVKVALPHYAPAIVTGTLSTVSILGGYRVISKRTAAFAAAYEMASTNLKTYQNKVKELYGDKKEEKVRNEIAKDEVEKDPPTEENTKEVIVTDGSILFRDKFSGRYFRSTVDLVRQAEKKIQQDLFMNDWVPLNDLYYYLELDPVDLGDDFGFNVGEGIDIIFNSIVAPGNQPALVMEYAVNPRYDYTRL